MKKVALALAIVFAVGAGYIAVVGTSTQAAAGYCDDACADW